MKSPPDTRVSASDAQGVALTAIQGLHAELAEQRANTSAALAEKDREIAVLNAALAEQKSRVASLEALANDVAEMKAQLLVLRRPVPAAISVSLQP